MKINEFDKQVTQADIDELEKFADKIFGKVGIDVNFTRHFLDRVNDERNGKPISMSELTRLFKQEQKRWGKKIAQLGPDEEAVMKDLQTDINLPFALRWDDKNNELDLIAKTVMRKKNFRTPNPEFPVESKLPPHLAKHFDKDGDAVKGSWKDGEWKADKKQPKKIKSTVKDVTPKGYGPLEEDFGSVPPLAELILMAVIAKTSVDVLIGMFKVALKTGKGLKKLNDLRKRVTKIGQDVADYAMPYESIDEATRDELLAKLQDQNKGKMMQAALDALHRLATSKGNKQSIGGYAFDIARAFNGVNARELEKMYKQMHESKFVKGSWNSPDVTAFDTPRGGGDPDHAGHVANTTNSSLIAKDKKNIGIQVQLRKAFNLDGNYEVAFQNGEKKNVDRNTAGKVMSKIDKIKAPNDKLKIINAISQSYENLIKFADHE